MRSESLKRAQRKYAAQKVVRKTLSLTRSADAEIIARLESVDNVSGYIKSLIRADIAAQAVRKTELDRRTGK